MSKIRDPISKLFPELYKTLGSSESIFSPCPGPLSHLRESLLVMEPCNSIELANRRPPSDLVAHPENCLWRQSRMVPFIHLYHSHKARPSFSRVFKQCLVLRMRVHLYRIISASSSSISDTSEPGLSAE